MRHRHDSEHGDHQFHPGGPEQAQRPPHYAGPPDDEALYSGLPSVTNRDWHADPRAGMDWQRYRGQGGFGESQGRHAQSGQGRGGVEFSGRDHDSRISRGPQPGGYRGRGPRGYTRPDASIADDVIDRLTDDVWIDASQILVAVEDGLVTLTGNTRTRAMKRRAEDIAALAGGVRDVRNEIRIDDGGASSGPPGAAVRSDWNQPSGVPGPARPDPGRGLPAR